MKRNVKFVFSKPCKRCNELFQPETRQCKICKKCDRRYKKNNYKLGEEIEGICPICFGRGRKKHLEYNGNNEVICMVCSTIIKIKDRII
jgi:DnaJ-class molecular chaperone